MLEFTIFKASIPKGKEHEKYNYGYYIVLSERRELRYSLNLYSIKRRSKKTLILDFLEYIINRLEYENRFLEAVYFRNKYLEYSSKNAGATE